MGPVVERRRDAVPAFLPWHITHTQMSASPPPVVPRKPSGVRVMMPPGEQLPAAVLPTYPHIQEVSGVPKHTALVNAEREVDILNHCFDDMEQFMSRLQQRADVVNAPIQKKKKKGKKNKKADIDDLEDLEENPITEGEFVDIFQKVKYSLSLLSRLKTSIADPDSSELLHHVFVPLDLMVKTTGGPELAATVNSPALTTGAISLLQEHLTEEEKDLWASLGPSWTLDRSQLSESVPAYTPVFLDGWQPQALDSDGQPFDDPVESQHQEDACAETSEDTPTTEEPISEQPTVEADVSDVPLESERLYCCSYDFVARNSSELSVLQGETLEVIDSSKRWWKCQNRFDQIGFVPSNILEPLSALNNNQRNNPVVRQQSKKVPLAPPPNKSFSYTPVSPTEAGSPIENPTPVPPTTLQGEGGDKVPVVNEELLQWLANGRSGSIRPLVIPRTTDTSAPLNYHSTASEVEAWLTGKGFSPETAKSLGILTGAQLFSLNKEELRTVSPEEGSRVYSQIMVQKALLEDVRKATELEDIMQRQKMKADVMLESEIL